MDKFVPRKLGLFLLVVLLNSVGYKLAQFLRPEGVLVTTWLDSFIPFIPAFVVPYALYPIIGILPFVVFWKSYRKYKTVALSMVAVLAISIAVFLAFQTSITRVDFVVDDLFTWGVSVVYSLDEPLNALPSLHVAIPVIATLFIYAENKRLGLCILPMTVLVALSTVFIKQHAILDVIAGMALALAVFKCRKFFSSGKK